MFAVPAPNQKKRAPPWHWLLRPCHMKCPDCRQIQKRLIKRIPSKMMMITYTYLKKSFQISSETGFQTSQRDDSIQRDAVVYILGKWRGDVRWRRVVWSLERPDAIRLAVSFFRSSGCSSQRIWLPLISNKSWALLQLPYRVKKASMSNCFSRLECSLFSFR